MTGSRTGELEENFILLFASSLKMIRTIVNNIFLISIAILRYQKEYKAVKNIGK